MMFKVLLCIPPDYDYNFPPLGTPVLSAFLKQRDIETVQVDLNLKYRDFLTEHICGSSINLQQKRFLLKIILKKFFAERLKDRYYSELLPRDNDGISPYLPYDNNTNSSFYFTERLLSSEYLWRYLEDRGENTFYQFYEEDNFLRFLEKEDIKLIGISIISPSQAIAALTLGFLVKKYLPHIHVSIGGQWPTLYRTALSQKKELFRCFDSITVFEGETPLYKLAMLLKTKRDLSIPNIILKDSEPDTNPHYTEEDLNLFPCPDFDGLPLDDYTGSQDGETSLTFETSRGCYWSRCAYCVDLPLPKPSYRRKQPELVIEDIKQLRQRYNAQYLLLSDPGLSPRQMLETSQKILNEGIEINWWCMARLDNGFNRRIFELARKAGLKKINFGFESASDHICQLLNKGNKRERSSRIIRDCFEAGIEVDLQTMLGLPMETFTDGLETVDFLITHKEYISRVTFNIYYLTPANFIYQEPERYGIEYDRDPSLPFRFFIQFKNLYGMSEDEAYLLEKIYYSLLRSPESQRLSGVDGQTLSLSKDVSEGWLEFHLNQESCRMHYLHNKLTDEFLFMEEEEKEIFDSIRNGLNLNQLNMESSEFLEEAINKGFLTER